MNNLFKGFGLGLAIICLLGFIDSMFSMSPHPAKETVDFFIVYSPAAAVFAVLYAMFKQ